MCSQRDENSHTPTALPSPSFPTPSGVQASLSSLNSAERSKATAGCAMASPVITELPEDKEGTHASPPPAEGGQAAGASHPGRGEAEPVCSVPAEEEEKLTPEQEAEKLAFAERLKQEGNDAYKAGLYEEAVLKYAGAIEESPQSCKQQRAVYYANIAACRMCMKEFGEAVTNCTAALELDSSYTKALVRRASAYEELDDLDHALADYKTILERDKSNSVAGPAALRLEPLLKERQEKMKEEMMGKLKDLGNMVLGKFGLSVDNFKAVKDPSTGSYSINFSQQ